MTSTKMKLGYNRWSIAFKLFAVVILDRVSCGRSGTEERTVLRSMGIVLLQVSADSTVNSSALSLHVSGDDEASPPKLVPHRHGRGSHPCQNAASRQKRTPWMQFDRIQTATKDIVDSGTIALRCVAVVVVVIFAIFVANSSLKDSSTVKREQLQRPTSNVNTPLRQTPIEVGVGPPRTVSSAPGERNAGSAMVAHAPPSSLKQNFVHATLDHEPSTKAYVPPLSLKGKFLQATPHSSGESLEHVPQSLPPAQTGSRLGTQSDTQNAYGLGEGRQSSPRSIERLQMASMGVTPVGSGSKLQGSLGDGAMLGGAIVGTNQVLSYVSPTASLAKKTNQIGMPPPVYKESVPPHCEKCFVFAFSHLDSTQNEDFDIYGLSGEPLLRASTRMGPGLQTVSISMKPPKSPTLGSIHVVNPTNDRAKKKMQIRSKNDEYYADFIDTGGMRFVVKREPSLSGIDSPGLMAVNFDRALSQFILSSSGDGSLLGKASQCTSNKDRLEVLVNPVADPVLALLCFMAAIIFAA